MKTKPYLHQSECFEASRRSPAFAVLMEQGLGKTKVVLDTVEDLFGMKLIRGLLVVAPCGVHSNWIRGEIPKHLEIPSVCVEWSARSKGSKRFASSLFRLFDDRPGSRLLRVLAVNVEAFSSDGPALALSRRFLEKFPSLMVVDESSRIKTPSAARTKRLVALGRRAPFRRICTGTPVTQSPFDIYSQFSFLDPSILGFRSFYAFRHFYGAWEKKMSYDGQKRWEYENLLRYVHLDDLAAKIAAHSYRRTKDECIDLPAKIRKAVYVDPSPVQARLIKKIEEEGVLEFGRFEELTPLQITRLLRIQQVSGGFVPCDEGSFEALAENPKMEALADLAGDHPGKMVVWARFRAEIAAIVERLRREGGVAELHGGVADKMDEVERFQKDPSIRFLIGQQGSGLGVNLTSAETVVYYSNSFSYEQRYQSEDRCHRIGLKHPVVYVDLVMSRSVDARVLNVLGRAADIAWEVMDEHRISGDDQRGDGACSAGL